VQSAGMAGTGLEQASIVLPAQSQTWHEPLGHSLLLRQICADSMFAAGHAPSTSVWHEMTASVVLSDAPQHACPSAQSAASLHAIAVPVQASPGAWHVAAPPPVGSQQLVCGTRQPVSSPQTTKPGVHAAPPVGGAHSVALSPCPGSLGLKSEVLDDDAAEDSEDDAVDASDSEPDDDDVDDSRVQKPTSGLLQASTVVPSQSQSWHSPLTHSRLLRQI
jgi:hypothetical protein